MFFAPVLANVVWPALLLQNRLVTWWAIALGLIIEYFLVWKLTDFDYKKSLIVDVAMNAASALLGIVLIPLAGFLWEFFPGILLLKFLQLSTFNPITWFATFILATAINAAVETGVIVKLFKAPIGKIGFWWLCMGNALTVGIALVSLTIARV